MNHHYYMIIKNNCFKGQTLVHSLMSPQGGYFFTIKILTYVPLNCVLHSEHFKSYWWTFPKQPLRGHFFHSLVFHPNGSFSVASLVLTDFGIYILNPSRSFLYHSEVYSFLCSIHVEFGYWVSVFPLSYICI